MYPPQVDANGMPMPPMDPAQIQFAAQQQLAQGFMQYPGLLPGAGMMPKYWAAAAAAAAAANVSANAGSGSSNTEPAQQNIMFNPAAAVAAAAAMGFPPMPGMHGPPGRSPPSNMPFNMMQMGMGMGMGMTPSNSNSSSNNNNNNNHNNNGAVASMMPRLPMTMAEAAAVSGLPFGMVPDPATAAALMGLTRVNEHDPAAAAAAAMMMMGGNAAAAHKSSLHGMTGANNTAREHRDQFTSAQHNATGGAGVGRNNNNNRGNQNNNNLTGNPRNNNNHNHNNHMNSVHGGHHVGSGGVGSGGQHQSAGVGNNSNGHGNAVARDCLVEEFRTTFGKSRQWTLSDLCQHVVAFCQDQHGSRFIQQRLEVCSDSEKQLVFDEILPSAPVLMTDVFGNYVLQKLFEYGTPDQCEQLASLLKGQAVQLSMQMYGCRVVQKALEYVNTERLVELVAEFEQPQVWSFGIELL
jgi:pumilio RNA-binding family